jgi:hypothetical protein
MEGARLVASWARNEGRQLGLAGFLAWAKGGMEKGVSWAMAQVRAVGWESQEQAWAHEERGGMGWCLLSTWAEEGSGPDWGLS